MTDERLAELILRAAKIVADTDAHRYVPEVFGSFAAVILQTLIEQENLATGERS